MSEMVLSVEALPETLFEMIPTKRVKLRRTGNVISLIPVIESTKDECPLLGLTTGSSLTVDKFLATAIKGEIEENNPLYLLKPDTQKTPVLGRLNGTTKIPDDFNEPLEEMKEYMY